MIIALEKFRNNLNRLLNESATNERTLYPIICNFLQEISTELKYQDVFATSEESLESTEKKIGYPDITVRQKNRLVGWIEIKLPKDSLNSSQFNEQFKKYQESLENVLFTNLREWQLWGWGEDGKPKEIAEDLFDPIRYGIGEEKILTNILIRFFEGKPFNAKTPLQLAKALAKKALLLRDQVWESLDEYDKDNELNKLKEIFEKTLIQNLGAHEFSNLIAETLTYSLFLAFLEHVGTKQDLTFTTAIDFLPESVPILSDLYQLISKVSNKYSGIHQTAQLVLEQLKSTDIGRIKQKLTEHKPGEDPVIQFYEPFLNAYDPKEREARGVYYTPKPVVDYIIRSVDWILKNKFGKEKGLADESVNLLDPATGTGTFIMSAIQEIYSSVYKENAILGKEMVKQEFNKIVSNHILKHFYGFELLIAPYAIAHLKLTLEIERLGFNFSMTKDDNDKDNDRFKIYLANTLDDPEGRKDSKGSYSDNWVFGSIPQESESARKVKRDIPILVITGNPPYSNFGQMNQGKWILGLLDDYKKGLNEKKINLDDDFIKFIRFAQWKLEKTGQGIFAMITSNTFIDGITHRKMRQSLMETYDEIYIYNLHGNLRKKEISPDGSVDENVFENKIQSGVSINVFIKYPKHKKQSEIYEDDLWGTYLHKWEVLLGQEFAQTKWNKIDVNLFNEQFRQTRWGKSFGDNLNFFVPKEAEKMVEYGNFIGMHELFLVFNSGIITRNDDATIYYTKEALEQILTDFERLSLEEVRNKYQIKDGVSWKLKDAKEDVIGNKSENKVTEILYRPFDKRFTLFTKKSNGFLNRPIYEVMKNLTHPNLALLCKRQQIQDFSYAFVTSNITESCVFESAYANNSVMPLYIFNDEGQKNLLITDDKVSNFEPKLIQEFSDALKLKFISIGQGDLYISFGPEDIFYYIYSIFHSPTYRERYSEQLKIDFPRFPLTNNKEMFRKLVKLGNELVNLHLLGDNPFDQSKTILNKQEKWGIKLGGEKPENTEDWKVADVKYDENTKRVFVNSGQYFEGIEKEVWKFIIGGYQVCEKWVKDRKKANRSLTSDDLKHYMKIVVALRETIRIMKEIDQIIPEWPLK